MTPNPHASRTQAENGPGQDAVSGRSVKTQCVDPYHPRRYAVWYAARGFPVFPCKEREKAPATLNGFKDGTTDPHTIRQVFRNGHNIGLIAPPSVLVIDGDVSKDARVPLAQRRADTKQRLRMLSNTFEEVDAAPLHLTPSGGFHVFLRMPDGAPQLTVCAWPRGADRTHGELRGLGRAYVVAPPSATVDGRYRVVRPLVPVDALPVASYGLLDYLHPREQPRRQRPRRSSSCPKVGTFAAQVDAVRAAREGARNNTLNRSAFIAGLRVAAGDLSEATAWDELLAAADAAGLPEAEARATIASGLRAGQREGQGDR